MEEHEHGWQGQILRGRNLCAIIELITRYVIDTAPAQDIDLYSSISVRILSQQLSFSFFDRLLDSPLNVSDIIYLS